MGARALDDLAVGFDQRIGFARERSDLDRKIAFQPLGAAGADGGEAFGNALERRQAEAHLKHGGQQQHERERAEGDHQRAVEARAFRRRSRRRRPRPGRDSGPRRRDRRALDEPQPLVLRALRHSPRACRRSRRRRRHPAGAASSPSHSEREERDFGLRRIEPRDLPVPARQRQFEQRLAERLRKLVVGFFRRRHVGDERAQIDIEPAVEGALDGLAIERGQDDAGDDEDHTVQPVAQRNRRSASELARIG